MTLTEIVDKIAERLGAPPELVWGFVDETVKEVIATLNAGEEVKVRGLGSFHWAPVKGRRSTGVCKPMQIPDGVKLRFTPAAQFRSRRTQMKKYGVELDEGKVKEAEDKGTDGEDSIKACPVCLTPVDDAGACPVHGTEPFEPGGQGD